MIESAAISGAGRRLAAPGRFYYGWVIVGLAALAMVGTLPGRTQGLGLITEPLLADLSVDRVQYAQINLVATLVMSAMARNATSGGPQLGQAAAPGGGGLFDVLTPMLDANRDGSVMDDLAGMMGKYMSGR